MTTQLISDVQTHGRSVSRAGDTRDFHAWWQALAILAASWIVVLYLFWDTVFTAVGVWQGSGAFSHCFLVFPITIYMIWDRRDHILNVAPVPNYWGMPILAMICVAWLLGHLGAVMIVQQMAVVAMLQVLVFTIAGWPVTRLLLFPLSFLMFTVPFGEDWVRPLQNYTASFVVKALQLTGIPVFRDGWTIVIPSRVWEVVEACSGVSYVVAYVVLGCLFSYWTYRSWGRRLAFILVCFFGAMLAIGLRAYLIVMLAYMVGVDHLIQGWIYFSIVAFLLFWIGLRWREPRTVDNRGEVTVTENKAAVIHAGSLRAMALTALSAVALLGSAPLAAYSLLRPPPIFAVPMISAPGVMQPWRALDEHEGKWNPRFLGADEELSKSYIGDAQRVQLYIAYYRANQRQGAELINTANDLIDQTNWRAVSVESAQAMVNGESLSVDRIVLRSHDRTMLVWSWYWVGGEYTSNPYFAKLLELKSRLLMEQKGSAVIALAVDVKNGNHREAAETLGNFLRHVALGQALVEEK